MTMMSAKQVIAGLRRKIAELEPKAEKWDKAYSGVNDDEMPFTPERISLVMNFVNDHFPDFDTPKEFEDMITEYTDWETELTEAEDKLEAITNLTRQPGDQLPPLRYADLKKILGVSE